MTISVSTYFCSSAMPASASAHAARAFELERLGDHADGEDAELRGGARDHRRRAGAGAAAHAGGDEHHVAAGEMGADLVQRLFGGGLADLGLGAGAETFGEVGAELDAVLGARAGQRLRVGVGDDELDALEAAVDHVVDGVAAGAADADHGDARLEFGEIRNLRLMVMAAFRSFICPLLRLDSAHIPAMRCSEPCLRLEIVPNPLADSGEVASSGTQEPLLDAAGESVVAARPMQQQPDAAAKSGAAAAAGNPLKPRGRPSLPGARTCWRRAPPGRSAGCRRRSARDAGRPRA